MDKEDYFKIINDIHEGIDNRETRKQLRETIAYLSKEVDFLYFNLRSLREKIIGRAMYDLQEINDELEQRNILLKKR